MNPTAILTLISNLAESLYAMQADNDALRAENASLASQLKDANAKNDALTSEADKL